MLPKCSSEASPKLKLKHVELFQPICPRCKSQRLGDAQPLTLQVLSDLGEEGYVEEGLFQCPSAECGAVYPILGGIPFLMPQVQSFVNDNITTIMSDKKYAAPLMNLIGEFCNQGSQYETMRLSGGALKGTSRRRFKRYQFWLLIEHPCELVLFGLHFFGIGAGGRFGTF